MRKGAWRLAAVAAVALAAFYGGGGWYFSNQLYTIGLSAAAKRAARPTYDLAVRGVQPGSITLAVTTSSPTEATQPGVWGLQWPGGYGEVTRILKGPSHPASSAGAGTAGTVTWAFRLITGRVPAAGTKVAIDSSVFPVNPKVGLGLAFSNIYYHGPLGRYPAWLVNGAPGNSTWAITVHGNDLSRLDCMKIVPVLHSMGLPVMMITYRNDPGAPSSPSGLMRYGLTEWQDLQAAVGFAVAHGAHHVVLVGYSMGGGIVVSFLLHSHLAPIVSAAVLDAPMLDFSTTVNYGASEMRLPVVGAPVPQSLTDVAKWLSTLRFGVQWRQLDYLRHASALRTPILLFQGTADHTVPPSTSTALAAARPHLVTYVQVRGAGHLGSWNLGPARYDSAVRSFLLAHP